ncbi:MAG: hypothetical protein ABIG68_02385, partial [Acidobacteriota bacterium]
RTRIIILSALALVLAVLLSVNSLHDFTRDFRSVYRATDDAGDGATTWSIHNRRLFRSTDSGKSWQIKSLGPDRVQPQAIWVLGKGLPLFVSTVEHGLFRSLDQGDSWEPSSRGLPPSIGASPVSPVSTLAAAVIDPRRIYCATEVHGIYRSEDAGATWIPASEGLPVPLAHRTSSALLAVDPENPNWVYSVMTVPVHSHMDSTLLYRSANGGRSWASLKRLEGSIPYRRLSVPEHRQVQLEWAGGMVLIPDLLDEGAPARQTSRLHLSPSPLPKGGGSVPQDFDEDGIAVMHDDGTLLAGIFDLDRTSLEFRPTAIGGYDVTLSDAAFVEDVGDRIELRDDDSRYLPLPFSFSFYGQRWNTFFVNSNGSVSFGAGDRSAFHDPYAFMAGEAKIAPFWTDLDPPAAGGVYLKAAPDRVVVTWDKITEWVYSAKPPNSNTFQLHLYPDGGIRFHYNGVDVQEGLTGISSGHQAAGHFVDFNGPLSLRGLSPGPIHQLFSPLGMNPDLISRHFYRSHEDDYDALFVFGASELSGSLAGSARAYFLGVRNQVKGIGLSTVDYTAEFGSSGQLQGFINANSLALYPADVLDPVDSFSHNTVTLLGEEWGHRFLAFPYFRDSSGISSSLLGRSYAHWNYFLDSQGSVDEGNAWRDDGDGQFTALECSCRFGRLDRYL